MKKMSFNQWAAKKYLFEVHTVLSLNSVILIQLGAN